MIYFPYSLIEWAKTQNIDIDLMEFKNENSNYCFEVLDFDKNKIAKFNEFWQLGFVIRGKDPEVLTADDTGLVDKLEIFLNSINRVEISENFYVYGVRVYKTKPADTKEYFAFTMLVEVFVYNKSKAGK